ncbi:MAG: hypothetical protein WCX73_03580 [Candidatus Pacearchaeota archaeon]|jgi:hypothetical protein
MNNDKDICPYKQPPCETLKKHSPHSYDYKTRVREICDTQNHLTCPAYKFIERQKAKQEANKNKITTSLAEGLMKLL